MLFLIGGWSVVSAQNSAVLIDDHFSNTGKSWKEIRLNGATDGSFKFDNESLSIINSSKIGVYGLYNLNPLSENFYAETEFADEDVIGLALVASKNGVPDGTNFTMIAVSNRSEITMINQYDRQNDIENVHDPKKVIEPSR